MAISDTYAVQYLLEGTQSGNPHILWQEQVDGGGGYVTQVGDVEIQLQHYQSRTGRHLTLRFQSHMDEFYLHEPSSVGWLGRRKYSSEDERSLAEMLQRLMLMAEQQINSRRETAIQNPEQVRERLYRRLLFEQPATLQEQKT